MIVELLKKVVPTLLQSPIRKAVTLLLLPLQLLKRVWCRRKRLKRMWRRHIRHKLSVAVSNVYRQYVFRREMRRFSYLLQHDGDVPATVLSGLIYGWSNTHWSVGPEYARAILQYARSTDGPILECGSGLSTILLGLVAQRNGTKVWSLENDPLWAKKVRSTLKRYGIESVELCETNIRDYGLYWWYDPPKNRMPKDFSLVICDGPGTPPAGSGLPRGGRYGLLPIMRSHLKAGCPVLLDDVGMVAAGPNTIDRWAEELGVSYRTEGSYKPFGIISIPAAND